MLVKTLEIYLQAYDHTLFFTASGLVGNGPPSMRAGDSVVVFDGVKMPFIVRRYNVRGTSQTDYELLAPCYVEGFSNGEPATMARSSLATVEYITLF